MELVSLFFAHKLCTEGVYCMKFNKKEMPENRIEKEWIRGSEAYPKQTIQFKVPKPEQIISSQIKNWQERKAIGLNY